MAKYRFTARAEQDLADIIDTTREKWGTTQAIRYTEKLEKTAQLLADNPRMGIPRDSLSPGLFSFPYESHSIYYLNQSRHITIVRILHASMDPKNHI